MRRVLAAILESLWECRDAALALVLLGGAIWLMPMAWRVGLWVFVTNFK